MRPREHSRKPSQPTPELRAVLRRSQTRSVLPRRLCEGRGSLRQRSGQVRPAWSPAPCASRGRDPQGAGGAPEGVRRKLGAVAMIQLLDAQARLVEPRHPKILIAGPPGIGKTSLLRTLSPEALATAVLIDLEAGSLPIAHLPIASIRPRTWSDCRDIACAIGGPDPARAPSCPIPRIITTRLSPIRASRTSRGLKSFLSIPTPS